MQLRWFRVVTALVVSVSFAALCSVSVFAAVDPQSSSSNYQVYNTVFGSGGEVEACSDSYCSRQSLGEAAVGDSESSNYKARAGSIFSEGTLLEVNVDGGINELGVISTDATVTASTEITVRSYLSAGYVIRLVGTPPKIHNHTIATPATPSAAQPGVEQFGINVRENTDPVVGADATQFPDSTFAYGAAAANYNTPNLFMYNEGDVIAGSTVSSGQTNYTVSFIMNIASNTPAGLYTTKLHAIVIPTY